LSNCAPATTISTVRSARQILLSLWLLAKCDAFVVEQKMIVVVSLCTDCILAGRSGVFAIFVRGRQSLPFCQLSFPSLASGGTRCNSQLRCAFKCFYVHLVLSCLAKRCWKQFIRSNHYFENFQTSAFFFISSPSPPET